MKNPNGISKQKLICQNYLIKVYTVNILYLRNYQKDLKN